MNRNRRCSYLLALLGLAPLCGCGATTDSAPAKPARFVEEQTGVYGLKVIRDTQTGREWLLAWRSALAPLERDIQPRAESGK